MLFLDCSLSAKWTVGATADQEPLLLYRSHHVNGQNSRRVAYFQGAVYVETYEYYQVGSSLPATGGLALYNLLGHAGVNHGVNHWGQSIQWQVISTASRIAGLQFFARGPTSR